MSSINNQVNPNIGGPSPFDDTIINQVKDQLKSKDITTGQGTITIRDKTFKITVLRGTVTDLGALANRVLVTLKNAGAFDTDKPDFHGAKISKDGVSLKTAATDIEKFEKIEKDDFDFESHFKHLSDFISSADKGNSIALPILNKAQKKSSNEPVGVASNQESVPEDKPEPPPLLSVRQNIPGTSSMKALAEKKELPIDNQIMQKILNSLIKSNPTYSDAKLSPDQLREKINNKQVDSNVLRLLSGFQEQAIREAAQREIRDGIKNEYKDKTTTAMETEIQKLQTNPEVNRQRLTLAYDRLFEIRRRSHG